MFLFLIKSYIYFRVVAVKMPQAAMARIASEAHAELFIFMFRENISFAKQKCTGFLGFVNRPVLYRTRRFGN
jgi:hypothetical protein